MDDHNGQVIDGTARAHQWRRSRSQAARKDEDDQAARSDAPKSIAGSLLVPADMLGQTGPLEHPDDCGARQEDTEPSRSAPIAQRRTGAASADPVVHQNPFLVSDAAAADAPRQRSRSGHARRASGTVIVEWANAIRALGARSRAPRRPPAGRPTTRRAAWLAGVVSVALASGVVALTAMIRPSSHAISRPAQIEALGASASSSNPLESRPLAAETTHVARERPAPVPRSHRARSVRARRSGHKHARSRLARKPRAVHAHDSAPPSSAAHVPASEPQTTGSADPSSSQVSAPPATSSPPASSDRSTSSSSQHQPAFGANGSLGPGSSPDS
jgi:hypothetical protein